MSFYNHGGPRRMNAPNGSKPHLFPLKGRWFCIASGAGAHARSMAEAFVIWRAALLRGIRR